MVIILLRHQSLFLHKRKVIQKIMKTDMRKILCPVDFSEASKNAIEFAAKLTKELSGQITFLYVRTSIWPEAKHLEKDAVLSENSISEWFEKIAGLVENEFGISSNYIIQSTTDTFEDVVSHFSLGYDLVVVGTNGVDSIYKYFFGSNSFHLIEKSKCPVLVVPHGFLYRPVKQIVYAYDPETNPIFLVEQLKKFACSLRSAVRVLHISTYESSKESDLRMQMLEKAVLVREPKGIDWSFDFQYSKDIVWALNKYLREHNADMLAISFHHHTLVEQLRGVDLIKEICASSEFPIFVLWH